MAADVPVGAMRVIYIHSIPELNLIFLRGHRTLLFMQIFWIRVVSRSRKLSVEFVGHDFFQRPWMYFWGFYLDALARILVYSMAVDGDVRETTPTNVRVKNGQLPKQSGYVAGSKALDSLDRLITSIETFFHPSNTGTWTLSVNAICINLFASNNSCPADYIRATPWCWFHQALERRGTSLV